MNFIIRDSYQELDVDWVILDPSRLLQIMINLLTNVYENIYSQAPLPMKPTDTSNFRQSNLHNPKANASSPYASPRTTRHPPVTP
jgi:hypothetical protein